MLISIPAKGSKEPSRRPVHSDCLHNLDKYTLCSHVTAVEATSPQRHNADSLHFIWQPMDFSQNHQLIIARTMLSEEATGLPSQLPFTVNDCPICGAWQRDKKSM